MKKKSLITMLLALTLVGAVGIGATLAYLSDSTGAMTNTFTVGSGIDITQDETDIDEYDPENPPEDPADIPKTEDGNDYTDIMPGDVLVKDPTVTVKANSSDCYVFMELTGADELTAQGFTFDGFNASWVKVSDEVEGAVLDGVYQYKNAETEDVVVKSEETQRLAPLFTTVTYAIDAEELAEDVELSDVVIKSCAVQADNMDAASALTAAIETINR
uniref:SipW-dependent-type signal peptide-containing protein n=1 Tax=Acetatifactor sp. TaxID=1872090 RepID=UPI0040562AE6